MSIKHINSTPRPSVEPGSGNTGELSVAPSCRATTKTGEPCGMRPMSTGWCVSHDPNRASERRAERSRAGSLSAAHAALARAKAQMVAKYGIQGELPSLDSVESLGAYLATVAARVETRQITPAQANSLVGVVRMAKDLLGLGIDVKLAQMLEQEPGR